MTLEVIVDLSITWPDNCSLELEAWLEEVKVDTQTTDTLVCTGPGV